MTIELGTVLTIVTMIAALLVFYFTNMRGLDQRLSTLKDEVVEKIDRVKDHTSNEIAEVKIVQANHGTRLTAVESFARDINQRVNGHVNGKHT